jgi:hypothetical protein
MGFPAGSGVNSLSVPRAFSHIGDFPLRRVGVLETRRASDRLKRMKWTERWNHSALTDRREQARSDEGHQRGHQRGPTRLNRFHKALGSCWLSLGLGSSAGRVWVECGSSAGGVGRRARRVASSRPALGPDWPGDLPALDEMYAATVIYMDVAE